jgi:hypothetical protein
MRYEENFTVGLLGKLILALKITVYPLPISWMLWCEVLVWRACEGRKTKTKYCILRMAE